MNIEKTADKGFTLIELIVVISIISVLAGLTGMNSGYFLNRARDAKVKDWLSRARSAQAAYIVDNQKMPDNMSELVPKYIKSLPENMKGANATLRLSYDSSTGIIGIEVATGEKTDFSGQLYEEY